MHSEALGEDLQVAAGTASEVDQGPGVRPVQLDQGLAHFGARAVGLDHVVECRIAVQEVRGFHVLGFRVGAGHMRLRSPTSRANTSHSRLGTTGAASASLRALARAFPST